MSKVQVPGYLLHKRSGKARVLVRNHLGHRQEVRLPGPHNSLESRQAYEHLLNELRRNGGRLAPPIQSETLTVNELLLLFWRRKVEVDYVDADKQPTSEQACQRLAIRPFRRLFGASRAAEFDSRALKVLQQAMAEGSWLTAEEKEARAKSGKPTNWCRTLVNRNISRIRSIFKWATAEKLVSSAVWAELQAVQPLKKGRGSRESKPVTPIDPTIVSATIPHLPPHVADMVRVQLLTGARPGEICSMRGKDIDRSGDVWIFAPTSHKTEHHGHSRSIAIGPQAQAILTLRMVGLSMEEHIFSPARQHAERMLAKRALRKTKVQPSQSDRSNPKAIRKPRQHFVPQAYAKAVTRACRAAGVPFWHPHQLRHTAALHVERQFGAEAARAVLGHRTINVTLHYAGIDKQRAAEVARRMG